MCKKQVWIWAINTMKSSSHSKEPFITIKSDYSYTPVNARYIQSIITASLHSTTGDSNGLHPTGYFGSKVAWGVLLPGDRIVLGWTSDAHLDSISMWVYSLTAYHLQNASAEPKEYSYFLVVFTWREFEPIFSSGSTKEIDNVKPSICVNFMMAHHGQENLQNVDGRRWQVTVSTG